MSYVKKLCKIIHYSFCRKVFFRSLIIISYSVIFIIIICGIRLKKRDSVSNVV